MASLELRDLNRGFTPLGVQRSKVMRSPSALLCASSSSPLDRCRLALPLVSKAKALVNFKNAAGAGHAAVSKCSTGSGRDAKTTARERSRPAKKAKATAKVRGLVHLDERESKNDALK